MAHNKTHTDIKSLLTELKKTLIEIRDSEPSVKKKHIDHQVALIDSTLLVPPRHYMKRFKTHLTMCKNMLSSLYKNHSKALDSLEQTFNEALKQQKQNVMLQDEEPTHYSTIAKSAAYIFRAQHDNMPSDQKQYQSKKDELDDTIGLLESISQQNSTDKNMIHATINAINDGKNELKAHTSGFSRFIYGWCSCHKPESYNVTTKDLDDLMSTNMTAQQ